MLLHREGNETTIPSWTLSTPKEELAEETIEFGWKKLVYIPVVTPGLVAYPVYSTETFVYQKCRMKVFVQGNLDELEGKTIFLTVHDIAKNHHSFVDFVNSEQMAEVKEKSIFLHVCVPGQEPGAAELENDFPSMDQLGDALAQVMAKFNLSKCVAIGEGAGADICCRFAMNYHHLVQGLVLIHCTSTTHGFMEHVKEILLNLRLEDGQMSESAWNYLLLHRFGHQKTDEKEKNMLVEHVKNEDGINETNLSHYLYSFAHRHDFSGELKEQLGKVDAVLLTGAKSAHNDYVQHMFGQMNKSKTALLVAEDAVDVLEEAPEYVTSALILLCQRKGIFSDLDLPIGARQGMPESLT